jgi:hypothetical protein
MIVNRIYHIRPRLGGYRHHPVEQRGGATVLVEGDTDHQQLTVRVAMCNPTDNFNKKLGRAVASQAQPKIIPLRNLPGFLGAAFKEVHRRAKMPIRITDSQFDGRVLDFLPKEL